MNVCLASQQTAERNWCTERRRRKKKGPIQKLGWIFFLFFFFYIKKQNTAGGEEAEGRARDERMGRGWREKGGVLCLFQSAEEILYSLLTLA